MLSSFAILIPQLPLGVSRLLRFGLLLGCLTLSTACEPSVETRAVEGQLQAGAGSVWVVEDPATKGRLFLCGTIHILREEDYPLAPAYEGAYAHSDRLVSELPPGASSGSALAERMSALGTYPPGQSLETEMGPEIWGKVKSWANAHKIPALSLRQMRPWFVALIITATEYAALGAKPEHGVDQHYENRAKRDGKPGEGLETVDFQLQLFSKLDPQQQRNLLDQTLAEVKSISAEYETMITAWKSGNLEDLHEMLFREAERYPELMDLFLTDRNKAWLAPLEKMLKQGEQVMVLVGTGHFTGKQGLLQLLRDRGYQVSHYEEVKDRL